MRIRWRPLAKADRDNIIDYIAHDNPLAAIELGDTINERVAELPTYPKLYRVRRVKGTREMVAHPNYPVVYRVRGDSIEIVRVPHRAQQWPPARGVPYLQTTIQISSRPSRADR